MIPACWRALGLALAASGCVTVHCTCTCAQDAGDCCPSAASATQSAAPTASVPVQPAAPAVQQDPVQRPVAVGAPHCSPPALQELDAIPTRAELTGGDPNVLAAFEVDGDQLIAVGYQSRAVAEGALSLWRELVLRIPTNQRPDLVQFEITRRSDPAGSTDNSGTGSHTGRFGTVLAFSQTNLERNQEDPCAPLARRRGTYDWTLVHEFSHMRCYADGTVNEFVQTFGGRTGAGEGYPEDGSPRLDGGWVSSYAERAGGDEDCAESFTAFVMLDELPEGDSLAARKVRWFASQPGYPELRRALRITEPDGSSAALEPVPRAEFPLVVEPTTWMVGRWRGALEDGSAIEYTITRDDIVRVRFEGEDEVERWSYKGLRAIDPLSIVDLYEVSESFYLHQVSVAGTPFSESFRLRDGQLVVDNERLGDFTLEPAP